MFTYVRASAPARLGARAQSAAGRHYGAANGLEVGRRRAIAILREIKSVKFKRKMICQEDGA